MVCLFFLAGSLGPIRSRNQPFDSQIYNHKDFLPIPFHFQLDKSKYQGNSAGKHPPLFYKFGG